MTKAKGDPEYFCSCGTRLLKANNHGKWWCPNEDCEAFDFQINKMGQVRQLSVAGVSYPQYPRHKVGR